MRILVVDDDPRIRETLAQPLSASGYDVSSAGDGEQALRSVEEQRPDLIILDVTLPGIDGFEVCHELRDWERLSGLPPTPVIGINLHIDPTGAVLFSATLGNAFALPIPLPGDPGVIGTELFGQAIFIEVPSGALAASPGVSLTVL